MVLTPGQAGDAPVYPDLMAGVPPQCPVEYAVADKAYDSDAIREDLADRKIVAAIPARANRKDPRPHDPAKYRQRNKVERLFGKLKQFRRIATRYEKLGCTFLALVKLVAAFVMTR